MGIRLEKVVLELDDSGFSTKVVKDAAAVALLNKELDGLGRQSVQTSRATARISKDVDTLGASSSKADQSINQLTGRLRLFADIAATLGPSLVPIGAVAVPAVAGLANELGVAALAGGTAIAAFQGVGDALTAMSEYAAEPTTENMAELREAMEDISAPAQELVEHLFALGPVLRELRDTGAANLFPGLIEGIDNLTYRIPDVERIIANISATMGELLGEGGESLASDRWDDFFDFLATDATSTLVDLGGTVGSLAHGMAELWMAFDPLNDDFSGWLRDIAADFDRWAQGLSKTEGFQEFVAYIRENGPKVADAAREIGNAVLQIAEAAAPLGGPTLQALEAVAKVIGTIADSNLGTPLVAMASLNSIMGRMAPVTRRASDGFSKMSGSVRTLADDLRLMRASQGQILSLGEFEQVSAAAERTRKSVGDMAKSAGRAAGPIAGMSLAMSGLGQETQYANTAMLGAAGLMAGGPWGGAIGAGVGLLMDFVGGQEQASGATDEMTATLDQQTGALTENSTAWAAQQIPPNYLDALKQAGFSLSDVTAAALEGGPALKAMLDQVRQSGALSSGDLAGFVFTMHDIANAAKEGERSTRLWSDAQVDLGSGIAGMTGQWQANADAIQANVDAMRALRDEALRATNADLAWAQSLLDAKESLKSVEDGGKNLRGALEGISDSTQVTTRRQVEAMKVLTDLASNWNGLSDEVKNTPGRLAEARREFLSIAEQMDMSKESARELWKEIAEIPPKKVTKAEFDWMEAERGISGLTDRLDDLDKKHVKPKVTAEVGQARQSLSGIVGLLSRIQDKDVNVNVTSSGISGLFTRADGGTVPGRRTPYADRTLILAAPGEEVITNRNGEADRFRADRAAGLIPAYANGGTVTMSDSDWTRPVRTPAHVRTSTASTVAASIDYDRLASVLAQIRPVYGDVHLQPHDYNQFRREMQADRAAASIGGF